MVWTFVAFPNGNLMIVDAETVIPNLQDCCRLSGCDTREEAIAEMIKYLTYMNEQEQRTKGKVGRG